MPRAQLFDYDAAAFLTGLAPETIRTYCDTKILTRDVHFIVFRYRWRYRLPRRVRLITQAGIDFLAVRRYAETDVERETERSRRARNVA